MINQRSAMLFVQCPDLAQSRLRRAARTSREVLRAIRIHQWFKNLLIFVPVIAAHEVFDLVVVSRVCLVFLAFSLCASSGYVLNDLIDLKSDREDPSKQDRPFASGALSVKTGLLLAALLMAMATGVANWMSTRCAIFLLGYLLLTIAYSLVLKTVLLLDVVMLAMFYTIRVFLGGEAAGVPVSFWLAAFSTFFFFSIALVKRYNELRCTARSERAATARRAYRPDDLGMLSMWGTATGCAAVIVLALYINSGDVARSYRHPAFLWPLCLGALFWLNRVWILANRRELEYDPTLFALRDPASYVVALLAAIAVVLAV